MNKILEAIKAKAYELRQKGQPVLHALRHGNRDFLAEYNRWYSACLGFVEANIPGRRSELLIIHNGDKNTSGINERYSNLNDFPTDHDDKQWIRNQILVIQSMVDSVPSYLTARLHNLELAVADQLMGDLLAEAEVLLKAGYTRAAGAVAGVLLESHMKKLCDHQDPPIKYPKKAMINILNELLRDGGVYDQAAWRKVQWMGDIRNLCDHANNDEPKKQDVADLIADVRKFTALLGLS